MATVITGVITNIGREVMAKSFGHLNGLTGYPLSWGKYFRIGMGGYIVTPSGRVPKTPSPSLTAIEATGAPGDVYFQKDFLLTDLTFIAPSTMQFRCRLSPVEGNDDGLGNPPRLFEIGVFDSNNNMIVYTTFPEQTKAANKLLTNFVQVYF